MDGTSQVCMGRVSSNNISITPLDGDQQSFLIYCLAHLILFVIIICLYRYVIECCHCGVIYRSRQHWYGNQEPELGAIKTDNKHVWPQVYTQVL